MDVNILGPTGKVNDPFAIKMYNFRSHIMNAAQEEYWKRVRDVAANPFDEYVSQVVMCQAVNRESMDFRGMCIRLECVHVRLNCMQLHRFPRSA